MNRPDTDCPYTACQKPDECGRYGCASRRTPGHLISISPPMPFAPQGCICPPSSEQTCMNPTCPRKAPQPMPVRYSNNTGVSDE